MSAILKYHKIGYHVYADYTQLYISFKCKQPLESISKVNSCLSDIRRWMITTTNNNNNNILFYSANIQFNKNLFSALYKKKCVQHVLTRTCKLKITYIITIDI